MRVARSLQLPAAWRAVLAACVIAWSTNGAAQTQGGLYIAGNGFTFEQAAQRALAANPKGQRFFVLSLPPATTALLKSAPAATAALRDRVRSANGVLLVCQRDIDNASVDASRLVSGVVAVRGWPPPGSTALPAGQLFYPDEDTSVLPVAVEAMRRLRATCSS
jgi:hypothetical protein